MASPLRMNGILHYSMPARHHKVFIDGRRAYAKRLPFLRHCAGRRHCARRIREKHDNTTRAARPITSASTAQDRGTICFNLISNKIVVVPMHGNQGLTKGRFLSILKQAGIDKNEFR